MEELLNRMHILRREPLNKGWSRDEKHILTDDQGRKFLLRLFDRSLLEKKQAQFALLQKVEALDLPCSRAIGIGTLDEGRAYMVLNWMEGESADEVLKTAAPGDAYRLGLEAGQILQKLHQIPVPIQPKTWWEGYQAKIPRKIAALEACPRPCPYKDIALSYVLENMARLKDREQKFSHADYHAGNMIVHKGHIGIIDFDKTTVADPYDEFKPFCWNVLASEYFETGLINGYFDGQIPEDFFPILSLYAAESLISQLPWAVGYGETEVRTAYFVADRVLEWYDGFEKVVPTWYRGTDPEFD